MEIANGGVVKATTLFVDKLNFKINKKEGTKMIESYSLIDLYEKKTKSKILFEADKKIDAIREKKSLKNKSLEIIEKATNELTELYLSQLNEDEKEALSRGAYIEQETLSLKKNGPIYLTTDGSLVINEFFENEEIIKIKKEADDKLCELSEHMKIVKAHVSIAKTKEEVEEILTTYGILKKGKLVFE